MFSAASDSVMLWPMVNAVTMRSSAIQRAAEQQQADEEQDVIRPDQDVVDARRDERAHDRQRALGGAGVVDVLVGAGVEDQLLAQLPVFVDVDEGLVHRIVGEQIGVDDHRPGGLGLDAVT